MGIIAIITAPAIEAEKPGEILRAGKLVAANFWMIIAGITLVFVSVGLMRRRFLPIIGRDILEISNIKRREFIAIYLIGLIMVVMATWLVGKQAISDLTRTLSLFWGVFS